MMRTLMIKLFTLLILIIISSCSTRKLNRQKSESSASMQSERRMQELQKDQFETKRKLLLTDTTHEQYTVTIFPLDSFSFSRENGFRGKAERIEVKGMNRRVKTLSDSMMVQVGSQRGQTYEEQERIEKSDFSKTRVLESKSWRALWVSVGLLGIIVLGWWFRARVTGWFR
ncbi:MAG: hypothetical protein WC380_03905 [Pedobacter sp.]|jgi:hypothetical protein